MAGEIFISYRRADQAWARLLHDQLKAEGVNAWYDAQIGAGQDWRIATAKALEASQIFVLLFSANAALSSDIAKELAAATLEKKLIIPVRLENIAPKGAFLYELASRNWVNAFENTEAKLEELAKGLAHLVRTGARDESVLPFEPGPAAPRKQKRALLAAAAVAVVAVSAIAAWLLWPARHSASPESAQIVSSPLADRVAVLPFDVLGGGEESRALGNAVAEQIIAILNDNQVQTVARSDAASLNGPDRDAKALALGAVFILNGSVQSADKKLHVTVHLDHAATHATIWTANYDQVGDSVLEFQSQIAAVVTDVVKRTAKVRAQDPAEMNDVALGMVPKMVSGARNNSQASVMQMRDLSRALIAQAPKLAWGYGNLAITSALALNWAAPGEVAGIKAEVKQAAARALALDPKNGDAYIALALIVPKRQWAEQEAVFRKGLTHDPNHPSLQNFLAGTLASVGRLREVLALRQSSQILDPLGPVKRAGSASALGDTGHPAEAIAAIGAAARIWPSDRNVWFTHFTLLANFGHVAEARAMLDAPGGIPQPWEPPYAAAWRAYLDALERKTPAAKAAAQAAIASALAARAIPGGIAMQMLANIGDIDGAFALAKDGFAIKEGPDWVDTAVLFKTTTAGMRRDPRFMPLAAQVGLVDYWTSTGQWPDFCAEPGLPYDCRAAAAALSPHTAERH